MIAIGPKAANVKNSARRRVAQFDYTNPIIAEWGPWVIASVIGGVVLLASACLFIYNIATGHRGATASSVQPYAFAKALHEPTRVPATLNGFGLWNIFVAVLMVVAYGFPIAQFFIDPRPAALIHRVDRNQP